MSVMSVSPRKAKAWSVHAVTASGVILGMLALLALIEGRAESCLLWLGLALLVDGLDGTLARKYDVKVVLPHFDGSTLDLVIDYLTYVFIPAIFVYRFIPLPEYTLLLSVGVILLSSLFCFCNVNMKSKDNYFVGFPALLIRTLADAPLGSAPLGAVGGALASAVILMSGICLALRPVLHLDGAAFTSLFQGATR